MAKLTSPTRKIFDPSMPHGFTPTTGNNDLEKYSVRHATRRVKSVNNLEIADIVDPIKMDGDKDRFATELLNRDTLSTSDVSTSTLPTLSQDTQ